jgi:hypothetical protein
MLVWRFAWCVRQAPSRAQLVAVAHLLSVVRSRGLYLAAEDLPPLLQQKFLGRVHVCGGLGGTLVLAGGDGDSASDGMVERVVVCGEVGCTAGVLLRGSCGSASAQSPPPPTFAALAIDTKKLVVLVPVCSC